MTHTYYYSGTTLLRETYGDTVLDFFYDSNGVPMALKQNGNLYYYITNLQGDVIRLVDIYGNIAAMYKYDPYGNAVYAYGSHATINPLRYRGYYYDNDTGMYYLQSRYYDPQVGRFINADDYSSTGQGIIGNNMFAYCGNNPINREDKDGKAWNVLGGAVIGATIGITSQLISNLIDGKPLNKDLGKAIFTGAAGGALTALCPGASTVISVGMSAAESIISDIQSGENIKTIVANATLSAGFAAISSGGTVFSDKKIVTNTIKTVKKVFSGNHPKVKKAALKALKATGKAVAKEFRTGVADGLVVNYAKKITVGYSGLYTRSNNTFRYLRNR